MTENQIKYLSHLENVRHNQATELNAEQKLEEDRRRNTGTLELEARKQTETERSNLARETETNRSNVATETETTSANLAREKETERANKANEGIKIAQNVLDGVGLGLKALDQGWKAKLDFLDALIPG